MVYVIENYLDLVWILVLGDFSWLSKIKLDVDTLAFPRGKRPIKGQVAPLGLLPSYYLDIQVSKHIILACYIVKNTDVSNSHLRQIKRYFHLLVPLDLQKSRCWYRFYRRLWGSYINFVHNFFNNRGYKRKHTKIDFVNWRLNSQRVFKQQLNCVIPHIVVGSCALSSFESSIWTQTYERRSLNQSNSHFVLVGICNCWEIVSPFVTPYKTLHNC